MDVPGGSSMDSPYGHADCKQELHLGLCPDCRVPASPKGTRIVAQVLVDDAGSIHRDEEVLRLRVQCRNPACPRGSWTIYEPGGYPCRRYALSVVASGVGELAGVPGATLMAVALRLDCDRTTVARWVIWVVTLGGVEQLSRSCAQLDPDGLPPPFLPIGPPPSGSHSLCRAPSGAARLLPLAGLVLLLLERLAQLRRRWGLPLEEGPGLVAILRERFLASGVVLRLPRASPGMRVSTAASRG